MIVQSLRKDAAGLEYALSCLKFTGRIMERQREAVQALYEGKDVFLWLPTGYGKSICYQILPFLFDFKLKCTALPPSKHSVCVIVSPLISLMVDQVTNLRANGIGCAILSGSSGMNKSLLASEKGIRSGDYALLYCAPEAMVRVSSRNFTLEGKLMERVAIRPRWGGGEGAGPLPHRV